MNKDSERQARYDAKATVRIGLKLNRKTDVDIIRKLNDVPNIQGYIKTLIRRDLEENIETEIREKSCSPGRDGYTK
jgi:hypothetical protein